jgi:hypothetical protein
MTLTKYFFFYLAFSCCKNIGSVRRFGVFFLNLFINAHAWQWYSTSITAAQMTQTFVKCYVNFETNGLYFIQGSYKTWKSLNVLEFENKNSRPGISWNLQRSTWKSLNFSCFMDIFWNCLTFTNGHFVELILHVHIWQSCLKFIKVAFWTI